jgi:hypothetical protein
MAAWLMGQNAEAEPERGIPQKPKYTGMMPESEKSMEIWVAQHIELEPVLIWEEIVPLVREWVDEQTQRPAVLSYADFNTWAQVGREVIFTKANGLIAYEKVIIERLPNTMELQRIIKADEWAAFFDQYGGVGVIAGVVDQKTYESAHKDWQGRLHDPTSVRVVYYFSEPQEATFARMAF